MLWSLQLLFQVSQLCLRGRKHLMLRCLNQVSLLKFRPQCIKLLRHRPQSRQARSKLQIRRLRPLLLPHQLPSVAATVFEVQIQLLMPLFDVLLPDQSQFDTLSATST